MSPNKLLSWSSRPTERRVNSGCEVSICLLIHLLQNRDTTLRKMLSFTLSRIK